jgi:catechol 2,3-dioxygenase-like lactoylglutathione lyase family enzyme
MTAISHVGICVSDLERSACFYKGALGFKLEYYVEVGSPFGVLTELLDLQCRAGFFTKDGLRIELLGYTSPDVVGEPQRRPMNQLGITHLSLIVDDIDAMAARITEFGGRVCAETKVATPKGQFMFCTDPDGVRIELWERAK